MSAAIDPTDPKATAGVLAPPPVLAALALGFGLLLDRIGGWSLAGGYDTMRLVFGLALAGGALALGFLAINAFRAAGTPPEPWEPTKALAVGSVYEKTRNPMYQALVLIVVGFGFIFGSPGMMLAAVPLAMTLHIGVVLREEAYLEARFGDDYRAYMARVPRYGWLFG